MVVVIFVMALMPVIIVVSSRIKKLPTLLNKIAIFTNQSLDVFKLLLAIPKCGMNIPK